MFNLGNLLYSIPTSCSTFLIYQRPVFSVLKVSEASNLTCLGKREFLCGGTKMNVRDKMKTKVYNLKLDISYDESLLSTNGQMEVEHVNRLRLIAPEKWNCEKRKNSV